jgi:hypothetical protein
VTQAELLAKRDSLLSERAKLEAAVQAIREEEQKLLASCTHTYANGSSALVGGARVKVCVHCGRVQSTREEKLWG